MRFRTVVISLCAVLTAGVATAPMAAANPLTCTEQLIADLQGAPVPDPTAVVVVEGLNVHVNTTGIDAFSAHVRDAALAFASCATPNPNEIIPCIEGVQDAIVSDITGPTSDDETYLRYVHLHRDGASINGEYAVGDALAIASCVV